MRLRKVELSDADFLYRLLSEREHPISHKAMPPMKEHLFFVEHHPYRYWYIIGDNYGSVYLGWDNSIGIVIAREHQHKGYARQALKEVIKRHEPLVALPSVRRGSFIANIAPGNHVSKRLFQSLGFNLIQEVYSNG